MAASFLFIVIDSRYTVLGAIMHHCRQSVTLRATDIGGRRRISTRLVAKTILLYGSLDPRRFPEAGKQAGFVQSSRRDNVRKYTKENTLVKHTSMV
jgi:hypothetical protein